jgi:hypothetical protein
MAGKRVKLCTFQLASEGGLDRRASVPTKKVQRDGPARLNRRASQTSQPFELMDLGEDPVEQ